MPSTRSSDESSLSDMHAYGIPRYVAIFFILPCFLRCSQNTVEGIKSNSNRDVFVFARAIILRVEVYVDTPSLARRLSALDNKLHAPCHICVRHKASPPSLSPLRLMCTAPQPAPLSAPRPPPRLGSSCPCLSSAPSSSRRSAGRTPSPSSSRGPCARRRQRRLGF